MYKKVLSLGCIAIIFAIFSGCGVLPSPQKPNSMKIPDNMSESFKKGMEDGCLTATGEYTKNSNLFNSNEDYKNGWFAGRSKCNPSNHQ